MKKKEPKQKKKLSLPLRILMVAIVLVTVSLCGAILSNSDTSAPSSSGVQNSGGNSVSSTTENKPTESGDCVLVDDKIKATFIGAEDASYLGVFYVNLKIENNTDTDIVINLESADVDGETVPMITTGVPLVIRPGNSGQTGFIFSMVNLSISTMDEAEKATFRIVARNNDTYDTVYTSDLVTVNLH